MNRAYKSFAIQIILLSLIGCCSCSEFHNSESSSDNLPSTQSTLSSQTTFYSDSSVESIPSLTEPEVFVYETVPHKEAVLANVDEVYVYSAAEVEFGLGLSNPIITENILDNYGRLSGGEDGWLRECEKSDVLNQLDYLIPAANASDRVGWYEIWNLSYESFIKDSQKGEYVFDIDLVRYIMSLNGLRFWIDEIPYSFFESLFPEYIGLYNERAAKIRAGEIDEKDYNFVQIVCPETTFSSFVTKLHGSFKNAEKTYIDALNSDELRGLVFRQMLEYNSVRLRCLYASRFFSCGQIEIGKTSEGKYVAVPTKEQYEKLTKDLQSIPGCEGIDISKVETRDDLIRTGVDVERMDKIYAKVSA